MKLFAKKRRQTTPSLPVLQTERLVLRVFDPNDAVDVYAYAKNPNVGLMAGWQPHQSIEDSRDWIFQTLKDGNTWAIVEKKTGRVAGSITLRTDAARQVDRAMELGYALGEDYWGNGYATEACREVMRYAFHEKECTVLSVSHFPQNASSKRVIKKLGFFPEGAMRCAYTMPDGTLRDLVLYSMTEPEYRSLCLKRTEG